MLRLCLPDDGSPLAVLALGAHCDDIEIGCGGTLLRLLGSGRPVDVTWVVLAAHGERADEARRSAEAFLAGAARATVVTKSFRESYFPYVGAEVKDFFEELKASSSPDLILTHRRSDLHQDHRIVSELTWNTFRDHLVLEYEVPKYDGDLETPNVYVELDEDVSLRKVALLLEHFPSQRARQWFTEDTFLSLLRLRGLESNSPSRYAEGYQCRKLAI